MRHIIFHNIDLTISPLEIFKRIISTLSYWDNVVKASILTNNKFFASISTPIILILKDSFNE